MLAIQLYGDLSLRTSKDLDILVDPDDVELAEATMARLGYEAADKHDSDPNWKRKYHHLSFSHKERRAEVEIHWRLNPNPVDKHTFPQLWERRKPFRWRTVVLFARQRGSSLLFDDHGADMRGSAFAGWSTSPVSFRISVPRRRTGISRSMAGEYSPGKRFCSRPHCCGRIFPAHCFR
ncbi:nucleotidyltransferase family protein [Paenibacillus thailandensis]|uniref:nucleotidyltransferase family protein n=1 Tax=Paenibacillus thailandensis TaxID=393250 RepID=UPI00363AD8DC